MSEYTPPSYDAIPFVVTQGYSSPEITYADFIMDILGDPISMTFNFEAPVSEVSFEIPLYFDFQLSPPVNTVELTATAEIILSFNINTYPSQVEMFMTDDFLLESPVSEIEMSLINPNLIWIDIDNVASEVEFTAELDQMLSFYLESPVSELLMNVFSGVGVSFDIESVVPQTDMTVENDIVVSFIIEPSMAKLKFITEIDAVTEFIKYEDTLCRL